MSESDGFLPTDTGGEVGAGNGLFHPLWFSILVDRDLPIHFALPSAVDQEAELGLFDAL